MTKYNTNNKFVPTLICGLFTAALFIKNTELTASLVKAGFERCFLTLIPALFPLMAVSEVLNGCGALPRLGKLFGKKLPRFWGISQSTTAAVILGLLLGFPIGVKALSSLCDNGEISRDEFEHALGFCGIPSFAFCVNAVGISLLGSKRLGFFLFFSSVISALLAGLLFTKRKKAEKQKFFPPINSDCKSMAEIFTSAISSSTLSLILMCGYVVFFTVLSGCISSAFSLSSVGGAITSIFFELSLGSASGASVGGLFGIALCGFAVGWSGLSVHLQTIALAGSRVKKLFRYFAMKLSQGFFCAFFTCFFARVTNSLPAGGEISVNAFTKIYTPEYAAITIALFLICILYAAKKSAKLHYRNFS